MGRGAKPDRSGEMMASIYTAGGREPTVRAIDWMPRVIGSMGEDQFGLELMELLAAACGAQHCTLFRITKQTPSAVMAVSRDGTDTANRQFSLYLSGSYWRSDPLVNETLASIGTEGFSIGHIDIDDISDCDFRDRLYRVTDVGERILLCGRTKDQALGLSILRSQEQGQATNEQLSCLTELSATLLSILNKHVAMISNSIDSSLALTSLPEIEATLHASSAQLPRREAEVCARILYGICTTGIALELGIGEETVMTYRKRAYQRLGIGSQRELLIWYLRVWSRGHCGINAARSLEFGTELVASSSLGK